MRTMTELSKLISLVLRHKPERLGLTMDAHGWVETSALIEKLNALQPFDMGMLETIVATDSKQRYSFSDDKSHIRANQGHSIPVDLELLPVSPPEILWHGTATRFSERIEREGLRPMSRQYVHLSDNLQTARTVGKRHGTPVIYEVAAGQMHRAGYAFFRSENGVWLTGAIPPEYLTRTEHC